MAKIVALEFDIKMAKETLERAMDEFTYHGKTIRQWADLITQEGREAVPVVRCKDCKHRNNPNKCPMCWDEWIIYEDEPFGHYEKYDETDDDGFCHRGARMDGDPHD